MILEFIAKKFTRYGLFIILFYLRVKRKSSAKYIKGILMLEMKLMVHGRVQGVGYRHSIIQHIENEQNMARGYIWNKPNGDVEIVAQGSIEELKDIRRFAVTGSNNSEVREVEETIDEISEYTHDGFTIRY